MATVSRTEAPAGSGTTTRPRVVELWAPWCPACRGMRPVLDRVAADYTGRVDLVRIDVADQPASASRLGVKATPTLIGWCDETEVFRTTGRRTEEELRSLFEAVAGCAAPETSPRVFDRRLRIGVGLVLVSVGLMSGPAWPLVAVGSGIFAVGLASGARRSDGRT